MDFGFEKIMDFAMDIDNSAWPTWWGRKVMDKIMEFKIIFPMCTER